jgi:DNA-binding Lrp family transcriptional regulator
MQKQITIEEQILSLVSQKGRIRLADLRGRFAFSRQYLSRIMKNLVDSGRLLKFGGTRLAFYVLPGYELKHIDSFSPVFARVYHNKGLEEHHVLDQILSALPALKVLPDNVGSIFNYAFSEMFNNAIEHSQSKTIRLKVSLQAKVLEFTIEDSGVGVFRNIMNKRKLSSELEAIQDLLKGKVTTMPKSHSGEGIFFTSKSGDWFSLDSYGYQLKFDNTLPDLFVEKIRKQKRGTRVTFRINTLSKLHLNDVFSKYTDRGEESNYGFDRTDIKVKLYTMAGVHISRSQARRILAGLEKFKVITFDFDKVSVVGQAFADEIFRVFHRAHPGIRLETENMQEGVKFMVERAINEAKRRI